MNTNNLIDLASIAFETRRHGPHLRRRERANSSLAIETRAMRQRRWEARRSRPLD